MSIDDDVIVAVRSRIERGAVALVVGDLVPEDLSLLGWSGSPAHVRLVRKALDRVQAGEVEYLAVRAPSGQPIAKAGVDFGRGRDGGTLWQLVTHPRLRGLGLGTLLVQEAENRIRARGRSWAALGVENDNPRARALYERLGYHPYAEEVTSWEEEDDEGQPFLYETVVTLLHKHL